MQVLKTFLFLSLQSFGLRSLLSCRQSSWSEMRLVFRVPGPAGPCPSPGPPEVYDVVPGSSTGRHATRTLSLFLVVKGRKAVEGCPLLFRSRWGATFSFSLGAVSFPRIGVPGGLWKWEGCLEMPSWAKTLLAGVHPRWSRWCEAPCSLVLSPTQSSPEKSVSGCRHLGISRLTSGGECEQLCI